MRNPEFKGTKAGRDYYALTFMVQTVTFMYIIFAYTSMASRTGKDMSIFGSSVSLNEFSGASVKAMLLQLLVMVLDRVAYLMKNFKLKLGIHYSTLVFVHIFTFWYLPGMYQRSFGNNPALQFFYILYCIYFWLGSLQLESGYRFALSNNILTHSGYNLSILLHGLCIGIFRFFLS